MITYEASIRSGILKDYYITMSNIDRSDYYNIKFQKKPFMIWIWISVILISLGGFKIRFFKNAKKNLLVHYNFSLIIFIIGVFFEGLNRNSIYDTKDLVGKKLEN